VAVSYYNELVLQHSGGCLLLHWVSSTTFRWLLVITMS